jgi:NADPH-dependent 2,4-dienoyl-CoA reductase/sulfur reductase-like enzyme
MTGRPYDLVIVGGGPAGLTAAVTAAGAGLRTVLLDESPELGGQYFRQQPPSLRAHREHRPGGRRLIDQVRRSGVDVLTSHVVWGADETGALLATPPEGAARRIAGEYTLIAAGAHELLLPFPGWTLPGVVTPGFAMHTAVVNGARLGERAVVAGTGPFLLLVAQALLRAGVPVAAVADEAPVAPTPGNVYRAAWYPRQVGQFGGMLATLARHRVPWLRSTRLLAAEGGTDGVRRVLLGAARDRREPGTPAPSSTPRAVEADVVCVAYGFRPNSELPLLLGCDCQPDPVTGALAPVTDAAGRTSVPRVYAAGDGAGIGGAELAMARAYLAVADICAARGRRLPAATVRRHQRLARRLAGFARLNAQLFPPPLDRVTELPDDVVVCRCEAVSAGRIRAAAATGWYDDSAVKAATRAGMGPCQGRECAAAVAVITGAGGGPVAWFPREPVRPVRLASVAESGQE